MFSSWVAYYKRKALKRLLQTSIRLSARHPLYSLMIQVDGVFKEILEITGKIGAVNQMDVLNNLLEEACDALICKFLRNDYRHRLVVSWAC